jgi:hypothetical protein
MDQLTCGFARSCWPRLRFSSICQGEGREFESRRPLHESAAQAPFRGCLTSFWRRGCPWCCPCRRGDDLGPVDGDARCLALGDGHGRFAASARSEQLGAEGLWRHGEIHQSLINASNLSRLISVPTRISPALPTKFGSSKTTSSRSIPREAVLTESAFRIWVFDDLENRHLPSPGGTFRGRAPPHTTDLIGGSRLRARRGIIREVSGRCGGRGCNSSRGASRGGAGVARPVRRR